MKIVYGALFIGVLLLSTASPAAASVTWGDFTEESYFQWYAAKDTLTHYDYGLYIHRVNRFYYELHLPGNRYQMPDDFDIIAGNESFVLYEFTVDTGDEVIGTELLESHLALLPVQINGSSYFEYLFTEKTSLEYITNSTITSTSIANNQAIMKGVYSNGLYDYDVKYRWDATTGLLQEKLVKGEGGEEFQLVEGNQPAFFVPEFLVILIPLFLAIVAMVVVMIRTIRKAMRSKELIFRISLSVIFIIELLVTLLLIYIFLMYLQFSFGRGFI